MTVNTAFRAQADLTVAHECLGSASALFLSSTDGSEQLDRLHMTLFQSAIGHSFA
jgi:hypothetical protein